MECPLCHKLNCESCHSHSDITSNNSVFPDISRILAKSSLKYNTPRESQSVLEKIMARTQLQLEKQHEIQRLKKAKRAEEDEIFRTLMEKTREDIRNNDDAISSTEDTLSRVAETRRGMKEINDKLENYRKSMDEILINSFKHFIEAESLGTPDDEEIAQLRNEYGLPVLATTIDVAEVIKHSKSLVFLTGAGISAASGIPIFKNNEKKYTVGGKELSNEEMASPDILFNHPYEFWERYHNMIQNIHSAGPNVNHISMQKLYSYMNSQGKSMKIITQNIDGYHNPNISPADVYEIHGNCNKLLCTNNCTKEHFYYENVDSPYSGPPVCPFCSSLARPKVLLFTETYNEETYKIDSVFQVVAAADCLIVIGTSLKLVVSQRMVADFIKTRNPLIEINTELEIKYGKVYGLASHCEETLPRIIDIIAD